MPGEHGLLVVVDPGVATLESHPPVLHQHRRGGRMDQPAAKRHLHERAVGFTEPQPHLFVDFAQDRLDRRLAVVHPPAGKCPLTGMPVHLRRPLRDQHSRTTDERTVDHQVGTVVATHRPLARLEVCVAVHYEGH